MTVVPGQVFRYRHTDARFMIVIGREKRVMWYMRWDCSIFSFHERNPRSLDNDVFEIWELVE